jgi:hypothetical protein
MRNIFAGYCAEAGGIVVSKIVASSQTKNLSLMVFAPMSSLTPRAFSPSFYPLPNYSRRPRQHIGGDRDADLLCRLEIDNKLKFCRLQIGGLGAL